MVQAMEIALISPIRILFLLAFLLLTPSLGRAQITQLNTYHHQKLLKGEFQILVWNIYGGSKDGFQSDASNLMTHADIAIFQEANLASELSDFLKQTDFGWQHATSFKWGKKKMGVATGSQTRPTKITPLKSLHREVGFTSRKTSLALYFNIQGEAHQLLILNTHSINFQTTGVYQKELDHILRLVKNHQGPVILAGDFNSWNLERYQYLIEQTNLHGLDQIKFQKSPTSSPLNKNLPLDHIFYKGLKLKSSEVRDEIESSDHLPLTATFEL